MRLEFRLDETAFIQYLKEIEKEIHSEQQAFNKHEDVEAILARNKVRSILGIDVVYSLDIHFLNWCSIHSPIALWLHCKYDYVYTFNSECTDSHKRYVMSERVNI